ncbi:MAG: Gfo/Idh/MocA family oxidoreductase [Planctomycetes bacterium]|nr:Gfo/Idh/MocA family oxidoreductase [Planctomycetota bacterium]
MKKDWTRREFLKAGSVAVAGALAGVPGRVLADEDGRPIRIGLVGCGSRGTGAVEDALAADPNVHVVALADLFVDRARSCLRYLRTLRLGRELHPGVRVHEDRCFVGFEAYRRLLDVPLDVVLLATPPGFRPIHFEAAVAAEKHVFIEKPVAVDPAGVRRVYLAGEKARERGLSVVAGTQRRHHSGYLETVRRIREGAIGRILGARCFWNQGGLWHRKREAGWSDMEWQVRNWLYFDWLSGDHIVEQHVHNLDVVNWVLGSVPLRAVGSGGREVRTDPVFGNIYDHFAVDFEYPGGIHVLSMCRQMEGTDGAVGELVTGTEGRADPGGWIDGARPWRFEGEVPNPYVAEHAALLASIRRGEPANEARQVAEATMTAILGRHAAYTGEVVEWDALLASDLDFSPPRYEFGDLPVRSVPIPGRS